MQIASIYDKTPLTILSAFYGCFTLGGNRLEHSFRAPKPESIALGGDHRGVVGRN